MTNPPDWDDDEIGSITREVPAFRTPVPTARSWREQLLMLVGDEAGRSFPVTGRVIAIGRHPESAIVLSEPSISRHHARIVRDDAGRLSIEDLDSRNGTFVNGVPVEAEALAMGDRVQLGATVVLVLTQEDPLKDLLRERQKMEAIGRMAAGIAHDFNNVAAAALAISDHLAARLGGPGSVGDIAECLADLRATLERGAELTRGLAALGRRRSSEPPEPLDVASVCHEVARLCERTFGPRFVIQQRLRRGLGARIHRTELHQILINLCLNARDAMPAGGTLRIEAERASDTRSPAAAGGLWILVRVSDTGVGIREELRARIFEPFFTTKREGHGTGLGLATVAQLVEAIHGRIELESEVGRGSSFCVWLPGEPSMHASGEFVAGGEPDEAVRFSAPRSARILLVEDQDLVRRGMLRLLVASGHQVQTAANGQEAIHAFERSSPRPEIVLLDLDLPVLGGEATLPHLIAIDASVRVLVISGHWDPSRREALLRAGAAAYLPKPFDAATLRSTIAGLLEDRNGS